MDRVPICLDALFVDMLDTLIGVEINHHLRMQIIQFVVFFRYCTYKRLIIKQFVIKKAAKTEKKDHQK